MAAYTHQTAATQFVEAMASDSPIATSASRAPFRWFSTCTSWAPWTIGIRRLPTVSPKIGKSSCLIMPASPAAQARSLRHSKRWAPTRSPSSMRSGSNRSTCWASRSVVWLHRKLPCRHPIFSAGWFWSAPGHAAAKAWIPARRRAKRYLVRLTSIPTIYGFAFTSRRRLQARRRAANSSSAFGSAARIVIPK
jgi:hypothetical protein